MTTMVEALASGAMNTDAQKDKYLSFSLDKEVYGLEIRFIQEIIGNQPITPIPEAPPYVKGLINLRGKVLPVMDLRLRFGMPEVAYGERTCFIVIEFNQTQVGLIADAVAEVLEIKPKRIEQPQRIRKGIRQNFVAGMAKCDQLVIVILNLEELLHMNDPQ